MEKEILHNKCIKCKLTSKQPITVKIYKCNYTPIKKEKSLSQ